MVGPSGSNGKLAASARLEQNLPERLIRKNTPASVTVKQSTAPTVKSPNGASA
jgi:hypothetical protein